MPKTLKPMEEEQGTMKVKYTLSCKGMTIPMSREE
jgi:hypothetical protein